MVRPPPLPGSLKGEPFPLATPPEGTAVEVTREQLALELDNAKAIIRALRDQQVLDITPPPETRPSVRARKRAVAKFLGKAAGLLVLAPMVGAAVAKRFPEYSDLVDLVLSLVGLR